MAEEAIAIIDDDSERAELLTENLASEGFVPFRFECVATGVTAICKMKPSIILVANRLKWLHGRDLLWLKKQIAELADIPTIIYGLKKGECYDVFRDGAEDALESPLDFTLLLMRIRVILRSSQHRGVNGSFAHIPILDLLQMIVASRLSGRLDIDTNNLRGLLHFQRGQLISAWSDECEGEEAFMLLIRAGRIGGNFEYCSEPNIQVTRNISKPTDHLLLEIANSLDEGES